MKKRTRRRSIVERTVVATVIQNRLDRQMSVDVSRSINKQLTKKKNTFVILRRRGDEANGDRREGGNGIDGGHKRKFNANSAIDNYGFLTPPSSIVHVENG